MSTSTPPTSTVLCPVDFSPASEVAIRVAVEEAERRDAQLDLLHVWTPQPAFLTDSMGAAVEIPPPLDDLRGQLDAIDIPLPADRVRRHVAVGSAVDTIVDMSEDLHADLIVMGTHARHGLARWILGSVVEPVLRAAPCPVLVVRGPHRAATTGSP
ncbi:universal stress protein [Candidatus Laterigemmans baculatus]|uniref:universal stress protein n=1 Tax=Candidatus Laterigemmans baculatus TaxID=2770505 RepID=UPI0013DCA50E|nr:universal stress protein [Candidatus Laterigemmans baculatus]